MAKGHVVSVNIAAQEVVFLVFILRDMFSDPQRQCAELRMTKALGKKIPNAYRDAILSAVCEWISSCWCQT
ncbi:protein of unknown function [Pseudodesulfovibrio profundus]|uniref:Uncharacterized protein n=1 Tax=Pseudodesulfovibrio profundus TaxID=57320 RepID=A0A2C8F5V2_9BACT|nr:protein of unknown function [Pseudodesulfovibrio profundus]